MLWNDGGAGGAVVGFQPHDGGAGERTTADGGGVSEECGGRGVGIWKGVGEYGDGQDYLSNVSGESVGTC